MFTLQCRGPLTLRMKSCAKILWDHIEAAQRVQKDISGMLSEGKKNKLNIQSRARDVFVCTMAVTVESKHDLPFDSTHFIAWSRNGKSAPAAGCFHRSWTVASSGGVKTSRSQWGVSYRFDCVVIYLGEWVNTLHSVNFTFHWCSPAPTLGLTLIFHCFPVVALFPC